VYGEGGPVSESATEPDTDAASTTGSSEATAEVEVVSWFRHEPPAWLPRAVVVTVLIFFGLYSMWWVAVRLRDLLVILLFALFVGFALEPAVSWLAGKGLRRGAATILLYFVIFVLVLAFFAAFGTLLVSQVVSIAKSLPDLTASLAKWLQDVFSVDLNTELNKIGNSLSGFGGNIASTAVSLGAKIVGSIFTFFTIGLFGFFVAAEGPGLRRNICSLLPQKSQREVLRVWDIAVEKTAGYLYSRMLLALASAVATGIFLLIIDVPYALTLGLWVGLVSQFVPTIGTYIAGALPVLVALTESPWKAVGVLVFIIAYQQFENYALSPPLSARTMKIHPAVAFGSVIAGAALLGAIGALIALPAAATIQAFIGAYVHRQDLVESPLLRDDAFSGESGKKARKARRAADKADREAETADRAAEQAEDDARSAAAGPDAEE
jgi:predicted PurR-regulated permease PerM